MLSLDFPAHNCRLGMVRIQELPFRMLVTMHEQQGQIASPEILSRQFWPDNIFVEFDQGLSTATDDVLAQGKGGNT
jgi:hypothetical protein